MPDKPTEETGLLPPKEPSTSKTVWFYCVLLLVSAVANSVVYKKMVTAMSNYPFFLSTFTSFAAVPPLFAVVAYLYHAGHITPEMQAFPKSKFALMALFDCVGGIMYMFGSVYTQGTLISLLNQAIIPLTLFLTVVVLHHAFRPLQYCGALLILCGVAVVVVLPNVLGMDVGQEGTKNLLMCNMLVLVANIPAAMSNIYKELAFSGVDIEVNYLQLWVMIFQCALTLVLIPVNTLSFLGPSALAWSDLLPNMINGCNCLFGYNTVITDCDPPFQRQCDNCVGNWAPVIVYLIVNQIYNVVIVLVIKYGSSALLTIVCTLTLPLIQVAFSWSAINNPPDPLAWPSLLGLGIILLGLELYNHQQRQNEDDSHDNLECKLQELDAEKKQNLIAETHMKTTMEKLVPLAGLRHGTSARQLHANMPHAPKLALLHRQHTLPLLSEEAPHGHARLLARHKSIL